MKITIFSLAAWYSLIVSLATFAVVAGIEVVSGPPSREFAGALYGAAFWIEASSLFFGILSLFGIGMHGAAFILWKAVPGLLASGLFGSGFWIVMTLSGITC